MVGLSSIMVRPSGEYRWSALTWQEETGTEAISSRATLTFDFLDFKINLTAIICTKLGDPRLNRFDLWCTQTTTSYIKTYTVIYGPVMFPGSNIERRFSVQQPGACWPVDVRSRDTFCSERVRRMSFATLNRLVNSVIVAEMFFLVPF